MRQYSPADYTPLLLGGFFAPGMEAHAAVVPQTFIANNLGAAMVPAAPRHMWHDLAKQPDPTVRAVRYGQVPVSYLRQKAFIMPNAGFIRDQPVANSYSDPSILDPAFLAAARRGM